ncbi:MAG: group 1 truncated hemoglobin [Ferruginibacter sp.]|nr:group 1 truncated hemoglobin [Rhodoferax sp.]
MQKFLIAASIAVSCLLATSVGAQTAMSGSPATTTDASLYQALGERPGLVRLTDDFLPRLMADPRIGAFFTPANQQRIKEQLVEQFCMLSGGPCVYKGADMESSHSNLDIRKSDFHALVEVLQYSMDAQAIPFSAQNQLLAKLAPMYRDVVTVK